MYSPEKGGILPSPEKEGVPALDEGRMPSFPAVVPSFPSL